MKKLIYLIVAILILGLIASGCFLSVVPPTEKDEITSLTKAKPLKPPSGAHYNLNIIGKKSDWSGQGSYSNPNRHTMFVPENTDEFMLDGSHCYAPAPLPEGEEVPVGPGITIWMTQCGEECDDFAVLDGNAFDDCKCEFRLARGRYDVYIVAKAKPPKPGEDYYTDITGWVMGYDPIEKEDYFYFSIGTVNVKKKEGWQDATHIFEVSASEDPFKDEWLSITYPVWVFEYLSMLESEQGMEDTAYFWQYDNHGNKLVKVRFYKR
ncbi:hypothetical protein ES705_12975 [subsurface metagenome]